MTSRNEYPVTAESAVSEIWIDIVLTLVTCGIYGFFWQARQFRVLNGLLGHERYNFVGWFLLCLITCGIYHIVNQYMMAKSINQIQQEQGIAVNTSLPALSLILSILFGGLFGSFVVDALHQNEINEFFGR